MKNNKEIKCIPIYKGVFGITPDQYTPDVELNEDPEETPVWEDPQDLSCLIGLIIAVCGLVMAMFR